MTGVLFAATFSYGCEMANQLGTTPKLKEYAISGGKCCPEKEIRQALKNLASYLYYLAIAEANQIDDPFDLQVVRAHWVGNKLLENVTAKAAATAAAKALKSGEVELGQIIMARHLIKTGKAHHGSYAAQFGEDACRVSSDGECLWHLGQKRLRAEADDLEKLAKYG